MSNRSIWTRLDRPESVEDILTLTSSPEHVEVLVRPSLITRSQARKGDKNGFELSAFYTVTVNRENARFEKTYSSGHSLRSLREAAMSFVIANTRLNSDLKRLYTAGAAINAVPFSLPALLPGTDISGFMPKTPYNLDQFYLLAGIGEPLHLEVKEKIGNADGGEDLKAEYTAHYGGREYRMTKSYGHLPADATEADKRHETEMAYQRMIMDQRKLRRLGVYMESEHLWGVVPKRFQSETDHYTGLIRTDPGEQTCACNTPEPESGCQCDMQDKELPAQRAESSRPSVRFTVIEGENNPDQQSQSKKPPLELIK